jgi:DNA-binding transcriptional LysR family regulator
LLARRLKLAFIEIRQGIDEIDRLKGSFAGRIVVGTLPLARTYLLPKTVVDVTSEYPDLSVGIIDGPYGSLLHMLRHGEVDMIIGALRDPVPTADVEQETLFSEPLSIIARSDHPLATKRKVSVDDIMRFDWVVAAKGAPTRELFEAMIRRLGRPLPNNLIETSSLVAARCMLLESDRLTILSRHQIRYEEQNGILFTLPIELPDTRRPIGITTRADWHPTAVQAAFLVGLRKSAATISAQRL